MRPVVIVLLWLFASSAASALTLSSTAAGSARIGGCGTGTFSMDIFFNSTNNSFCQSQGVAEFDLGATGLTSVVSATLTLFNGAAYNTEGQAFPLELFGYVGDGQVTSSDYGLGSYFGSTTWLRNAAGADVFAIDVTDYVNEQLALGTLITGINIRPELLTGSCCTTTWIGFDGSDDPGAPTLSLQPVPVPASIWLLGSAFGVMGWFRRRA